MYVDNIINDVTPPIGIISSPHSGQTVSGNVNFTVEAQDENGISELEFRYIIKPTVIKNKKVRNTIRYLLFITI